jgi:hypothetical protein
VYLVAVQLKLEAPAAEGPQVVGVDDVGLVREDLVE